MSMKIDSKWLASQIEEYTVYGVVSKVSSLISEGTIREGAQLPTVRDFARQIGLSPASVSIAWQDLRRRGMIISEGPRAGIRVANNSGIKPERTHLQASLYNDSRQQEDSGTEHLFDLSWPTLDTSLLPSLEKALPQSLIIDNINKYQRIAIVPELERKLRADWFYPAEAFLMINGGFSGIELISRSLILPGSKVTVEIPTSPLILDNINVTTVPIYCDQHGPLPDMLQKAAQSCIAFIYQPRVNSATGQSISDTRLKELADVLQKNNILIIEKDGLGELFCPQNTVNSLAKYYPDNVLYIRSYSKVYGPDLRLGVISGARAKIDKIYNLRNFSCAWSSRILQGILNYLITDPETQRVVHRARTIYSQRRNALIEALAERGLEFDIDVHNTHGLALWLKVPSEHYAYHTLLKRGILTLPGIRCGDTSDSHIKITTALLQAGQINKLAGSIEMACCCY